MIVKGPEVSDPEITAFDIDTNLITQTVTLGLFRNRSAGRIQGNQATFDNSQRNNLRSCVWVSAVVLVRMFVLSLLPFGREEPVLYIAPCGVVGPDDSG